MTPFQILRSLVAAIVALGTIIGMPAATAAIPLKTEIALQEASPKHLHIEVLKVKKTRIAHYYNVTVTAKVHKVARSASNVKAGTEITLAYSTPAVPMPSAPPGLVHAGKHYEAFLKQDGKTYDAAAASGTFKPMTAPVAAAADDTP